MLTDRWSSQSVICAGGAVCAAAYAYLAFVSRDYGDAGLIHVLPALSLTVVATAAVWWYHWRASMQWSVTSVLAFAVLFRLLGVLAYPLLEDDFFRYLWDGYMVWTQGSPFGVAPSSFFDSDTVDDQFSDILDGINYPDVPTVYGPVAQWAFALAYGIAPGAVWPLQAIFALADLAVIWLLLRVAPVGWVFLYAWSPLMIKEFAFTAHLDVLGVAFLMLGLLAYQRQFWWGVGASLALALGVKVFALIVAPFLLGWQWRAWLAFAFTALIVALPFGLQDAWLPGGLEAMGATWLFNSPVYFAALPWLTPERFNVLKLVMLAGFALVWVYYYACWLMAWWTSDDGPAVAGLPAVLLLGGFFLLVSPVLNPWYLVWWLPFAVLRPAYTPWVASVALFAAYVTGINLPDSELALYDLPPWLMGLEFSAIAVAMALDLRARSRGLGVAQV